MTAYRCGVTHYEGCECHEKIRNDELESLRAQLVEAEKAIRFAHAHCEAIALSALLLPSSHYHDPEEFFKGQATKSVGSGGRAYHALKEYLAKYPEKKSLAGN